MKEWAIVNKIYSGEKITKKEFDYFKKNTVNTIAGRAEIRRAKKLIGKKIIKRIKKK